MSKNNTASKQARGVSSPKSIEYKCDQLDECRYKEQEITSNFVPYISGSELNYDFALRKSVKSSSKKFNEFRKMIKRVIVHTNCNIDVKFGNFTQWMNSTVGIVLFCLRYSDNDFEFIARLDETFYILSALSGEEITYRSREISSSRKEAEKKRNELYLWMKNFVVEVLKEFNPRQYENLRLMYSMTEDTSAICIS